MSLGPSNEHDSDQQYNCFVYRKGIPDHLTSKETWNSQNHDCIHDERPKDIDDIRLPDHFFRNEWRRQ